jgi:hypothetical protein
VGPGAPSQDDLPFDALDPRELQHANAACVGVYATVPEPGVVHLRDDVRSST